MRGGVRSGRSALRAAGGAGAAPFGGSEHDHQTAFVTWCRFMGPVAYAGLEHIFAVPNGGLRMRATAGKLRAEGVVEGPSDLILLVPSLGDGFRFHGLLIEMKAPGRVREGVRAVEPAQRDFLIRGSMNGYSSNVAFGLDAAKACARWHYGVSVEKACEAADGGPPVERESWAPSPGDFGFRLWRPVKAAAVVP